MRGLIGRTLAHYRIAAAIGAGGMGEVYRATDTKLGRDVALKVLPAEMASSPERLARFGREARAVAALNHPHIVTIHSVEEADGVRPWRRSPWAASRTESPRRSTESP
jgi:serine/threonine protein kinase